MDAPPPTFTGAAGLLVGSLVKGEEAASGALNLVILPMAFISGTFFEIGAMPGWVQQVSWLFPLRHLSSGLLDVFVREEGFSAALGPIAVLLGFAAVLTLVASRFFTWED